MAVGSSGSGAKRLKDAVAHVDSLYDSLLLATSASGNIPSEPSPH